MLVNNMSGLESSMFQEKEGTIAITNRDSEKASSFILTDEGIVLTSSNISNCISISNDGIVLQVDILFIGKGTSIKKSNYSENPNSAKLFTYTETVSTEADVKEKITEAAGKLGINTGDLTKNGIVPLMTNIGGSAGIAVPHVHTMMFKHVHRVEPSYLYRIPNTFKVFTKSMESLGDFFKTLGS